MECLKNAIGLTPESSFCYEEAPDGFDELNKSYSGYYVDNIEHGDRWHSFQY